MAAESIKAADSAPIVLHITQDGLGRLHRSKSPASIAGLFTKGLETCIAVILIRGDRVTLIHQTSTTKHSVVYGEMTALDEEAGDASEPGRVILVAVSQKMLNKHWDNDKFWEHYWAKNEQPMEFLHQGIGRRYPKWKTENLASTEIYVDRQGNLSRILPLQAVVQRPPLCNVRDTIGYLNSMLSCTTDGDQQYLTDHWGSLPPLLPLTAEVVCKASKDAGSLSNDLWSTARQGKRQEHFFRFVNDRSQSGHAKTMQDGIGRVCDLAAELICKQDWGSTISQNQPVHSGLQLAVIEDKKASYFRVDCSKTYEAAILKLFARQSTKPIVRRPDEQNPIHTSGSCPTVCSFHASLPPA